MRDWQMGDGGRDAGAIREVGETRGSRLGRVVHRVSTCGFGACS